MLKKPKLFGWLERIQYRYNVALKIDKVYYIKF
ncbi:hypothetical protein IWQ46_000433 [Aquimarina sp. EL_35]|nr:hypothetical protein [Aquimarina sp. EL_35]MBG6150039.1 hypothetical protein [Aquimarina sp. EL_32]